MKFLAIGAYFIILLVLAVIAFAPVIGFATWSDPSEVGRAVDIPSYAKTVSLVLLLWMIGGGLYYLWRNIPSLG